MVAYTTVVATATETDRRTAIIGPLVFLGRKVLVFQQGEYTIFGSRMKIGTVRRQGYCFDTLWLIWYNHHAVPWAARCPMGLNERIATTRMCPVER